MGDEEKDVAVDAATTEASETVVSISAKEAKVGSEIKVVP